MYRRLNVLTVGTGGQLTPPLAAVCTASPCLLQCTASCVLTAALMAQEGGWTPWLGEGHGSATAAELKARGDTAILYWRVAKVAMRTYLYSMEAAYLYSSLLQSTNVPPLAVPTDDPGNMAFKADNYPRARRLYCDALTVHSPYSVVPPVP